MKDAQPSRWADFMRARGLCRPSSSPIAAGQVDLGALLLQLVFVLVLLQALTGVLLMTVYVPSVRDAWSSVFFIQHEMGAGHFIRGLHARVADALVVSFILYLVRVAFARDFQKPFEFVYVGRLLFFFVTLLVVISGYRLVWDQQAFWALLVELNVTQAAPMGDTLVGLITGDGKPGQLALTRMFAAHTVGLPLLLMALASVIGLLERRALRAQGCDEGAEGQWSAQQRERWRLAIVLAAPIVGLIALWVTTQGGVSLDAPADPAQYYPARPEWFIAPMFALRKLAEGPNEVLVLSAATGLAVLSLVSLPALALLRDTRLPSLPLHVLAPSVVLGILLGAVGLGLWSQQIDSQNEALLVQIEDAERRAARSLVLAKRGIPKEGPLHMLAHDPQTRGRDVFAQYCLDCHAHADLVPPEEAEQDAPMHTGFASRAWIDGFLRAPHDDAFFGRTELDDEMPSQARLGDDALKAVTEWLFAQGHERGDPSYDGALARKGLDVVRGKCVRCHTLDGEGDTMGTEGPELRDWASRDWLERQVRDPDAAYGSLNVMPAFDDQLSAHDTAMVVAFLRLQRFVNVRPARGK